MLVGLKKLKEKREQRKLAKQQNLDAVHTHTHTHTGF